MCNKRFLPVLLFFLLPISAVFALDWRIDHRENWDVIISQFYDTIDHAREVYDTNRKYYSLRLVRFENGRQDVKKRAGELKYLFWDERQTDVFAITMYARQISDLKRGLDDHVKELERIKARLTEDRTCYEKMRESLQEIDRTYLQPDNWGKINSCRVACEYFIHNNTILLGNIEKGLAAGTALQQNVDKLYEESEKRRQSVMHEVIFTRGQTWRQLLPMASNSVKEWLVYLPGWLEVEVPNSAGFWYDFLLITIPSVLLLLFLGKRVYRAIAGMMNPVEHKAKFPLFMTALALLIVSGVCLISGMTVGTTEGMLFKQVGRFVGALGWLLIALLIRMEYHRSKECLLLYGPQIGQYFAVLCLYISVVSYAPLTLFMPVITLPMIILLVWFLIKLQCPLFDRVLAMLTVFFAVTTLLLSFNGLAYIGLTITSTWFFTVAGLQAGVALTGLVRAYVDRHSRRKIVRSLLLTLLVPAMWIFIVCMLVYWTANLFSREALLERVLVSNFLSCKDVIEISMVDILFVIGVGLVLQFVISTVKHLISIIYGKDAEMGLVPSFTTLGVYVAWTLYIIFVLLRFEVKPQSILVVLGGMSLGIGFGFKDIVENFISGIIILAGRQIRPGDVIEYNGTWGKVRKVSIRATVIETSESAVITLPNSYVLAKDFHNWTLNHRHMRRSIKISVAYGTDLVKMRTLLAEIAKADAGVLTQPAPSLYMTEMGDYSMNFVWEIWVAVEARSAVPGRLREVIVQRFKEAGIDIPGPQLNVVLSRPSTEPESVL